MKLLESISILGEKRSLDIAANLSNQLQINWDEEVKYLFRIIASDSERVPGNIGGKNDDEVTVIKKWLVKYKKGYEGRASQRLSNPLGTVADPVIEKIIGARLSKLTHEELKKISFAHRLGMSVENILGLLLEEYLSVNLRPVGWHCAWGETVKSVDFVNEDGSLLQIKNRSNSENSSSSAIRNGTEIKKWYRIKADRVEYMWETLNKICNTTTLSEKAFVDFATSCVRINPDCIVVESENPWG
jgi:SinI restriction endonuclease